MKVDPKAMKELVNFFGAYFHQDWRCDAESTSQVVANYLTQASLSEVQSLRRAILNFATAYTSDEELELHLFSDLGCFYRPSGDGLSARSWMEGIADLLHMR